MDIETLCTQEIDALHSISTDDCFIEKRIKVSYGSTTLLIEPVHIAVAYIVNGWVLVKNTSDQELLTGYTLNDLEIILNGNTFFRINRQLIAARSFCISYKPIQFGKLEVGLKVNVPVQTIVSQTKAKAFRRWLSH